MEALAACAMIKAHQAKVQDDDFPESTIDRLWFDGVSCFASRAYKLPLNFRYNGLSSYLKKLGLVYRDLYRLHCRGNEHTGDKNVFILLTSGELETARTSGVRCPVCKYTEKSLGRLWKNSTGQSMVYQTDSWMSSMVKYSSDFVERIKELCSLFGIELSSEEIDLEKEKYLILALCGQIIPQLKYTTNFVFNRFWGEIPPEGGPDDFIGVRLFPQQLAVLLNKMSGTRGRRSYKNQVLMNTLFQGYKRGLLPVDPVLIQKTLDKHRMCLQKDPSISVELSDDIEAKATEILRGYKGPRSYGPSNKQSAASTTCSTFADGGNIGYVLQDMYPDETLRGIAPPTFLGYVMASQRTPRGQRLESLIEVKKISPVFSRDIHDFFKHTKYHIPLGKYLASAKERQDVHLPTLSAVPACILEPMKVRMITKPSTGLHVRMHQVQKSLWEYLYNHPSNAFKLIGEELNESHLDKFLSTWSIGDKFCSGDYSAATDNLKGDVTRSIIKCVNEKVFREDPFLAENLTNSLTSMVIHQGDAKLPNFSEFACFKDMVYTTKTFYQKNGQLMGHVVSFVILCIANVISYWRSIEKVHGKISFKDLNNKYPVLVNGDDILFKSQDKHYKTWTAEIKEFGFDPSIGKNFFNDRFLQINSQLYRVDTYMDPDVMDARIKGLVKIPMVNFGLITNRGKNDCSKDLTVQRVGAEIEENSLLGRLKTLVKTRRAVMLGLPDVLRVRTEALFKKHSDPMLKHFGLLGLRRILHTDAADEMLTQFVKNEKINTGAEAEYYRCFPEVQDVKIDRGELTFEFARIRDLEKVLTLRNKSGQEENHLCALGDPFDTIAEAREQARISLMRV